MNSRPFLSTWFKKLFMIDDLLFAYIIINAIPLRNKRYILHYVNSGSIATIH